MQEQILDEETIKQIFDKSIENHRKEFDAMENLSNEYKTGFIKGLEEAREMTLCAHGAIVDDINEDNEGEN